MCKLWVPFHSIFSTVVFLLCSCLVLAFSCRDNPDVQMKFMYSETLAHQIYAAADMLLVPSLFEPCGLTQVGGRVGTRGWVGGGMACGACDFVQWGSVAGSGPQPSSHAISLPAGAMACSLIANLTRKSPPPPLLAPSCPHLCTDDCAAVRHRPRGALHRRAGRHRQGRGQPPGQAVACL